MNQKKDASIIVTPIYHVPQILDKSDVTHVISILGPSDRLPWPDVGARKSLRLWFDDTQYTSGRLVAPAPQHIEDMIAFVRDWDGRTSMVIHCRAGSSRSPACGWAALAAIGRTDLIHGAWKSFWKPHQGCLRIADSLISPNPGLVDLAQSVPVPTRTDEWGPVRIPLNAPAGT